MEENNKLITIQSTGLIKVSNSIAITNKLLKEYEDRLHLLDWNKLYEFEDFFNQFFSTFYPFTEKQLIEFSLITGYPSETIHDVGSHSEAVFGLIYNKNIIWTEKLKKIYYTEPYILWAADYDQYSFELIFDELPFDISKEVEGEKLFLQHELINGYGPSDEEGYYDSLSEGLESLDKGFDLVISEKNFTNEKILKIISDNDTNYFANKLFCEKLMNKIEKEITDFSINVFYSSSHSS